MVTIKGMVFVGMILAAGFALSSGSVFSETHNCDMVADGAICLFEGRKVILPDAGSPDLIVHWSFDGDLVVDASGNRNHANNTNGIGVGPGIWGRGASAHFNEDNIVLPHSKSLDDMNGEFSMTFWMFLPQSFASSSSSGTFCPIVRKGRDRESASPSLEINTKDRKLRFTTKESGNTGNSPTLVSNARIGTSRWTHVAIVRSENAMNLYVNGVKDVSKSAGGPVGSVQDMILGIVDAQKSDSSPQCNFEFFMDEVRVYGRSLFAYEIVAEAAPSLGGYSPESLRLGCTSCTTQNMNCEDSFHVCTKHELYAGGYQFATLMGYADAGTKVWSSDDLNNGQSLEGVFICCEN